jgi:hypothetical protein
MPSNVKSIKETLKGILMRKTVVKNRQNAGPAMVSAQCYLRLMRSIMQFFNIKYELAIIASLLRKIKILEWFKPLKFATIYAAAAAENNRIGKCEISISSAS